MFNNDKMVETEQKDQIYTRLAKPLRFYSNLFKFTESHNNKHLT